MSEKKPMLQPGLYTSLGLGNPPPYGEAKLVAEFHCNKFVPGNENMLHEATGVMSVKLVAGREGEKWLPGGGDYTYFEKTVEITRLWEANVQLWLPWSEGDDWKVDDDFHNPLGITEQDAHDLVQTTGICGLLEELIEERKKAHA